MNYFPTENHKKATDEIVNFFSEYKYISSILLTCSCARSKASPESCVDIAILLRPDIYKTKKKELEEKWENFNIHNKAIKKMLKYGKFAHIDLDFIHGDFTPRNHYHGWMSGPDSFELEVGNNLCYSVSLKSNDDYYDLLRTKWLPFYSNKLREKRLDMVLEYCKNNLEHIESYVKRELYFQAFDRFYNAYREFLQALFIYLKKYPICYEKWIKEQIVDILGLPELYTDIVNLFEIKVFKNNKMIENKNKIFFLIKKYIF
jgi:predicted nucleotidyltransferase